MTAETSEIAFEICIAMALFAIGTAIGKAGMGAYLSSAMPGTDIGKKLTIFMRVVAYVSLATVCAVGHFLGGPIELAVFAVGLVGAILGIGTSLAQLVVTAIHMGARESVTLLALIDHYQLKQDDIDDIIKNFTEKTDPIQTK